MYTTYFKSLPFQYASLDITVLIIHHVQSVHPGPQQQV